MVSFPLLFGCGRIRCRRGHGFDRNVLLVMHNFIGIIDQSILRQGFAFVVDDEKGGGALRDGGDAVHNAFAAAVRTHAHGAFPRHVVHLQRPAPPPRTALVQCCQWVVCSVAAVQ